MAKILKFGAVVLTIIVFASGCLAAESAPEPSLVPVEPKITKITPTVAKADAIPRPAVQVPEGWMIYTNEDLGFSFAYPDNYSVLTDEDNLYGWENGVLLIYDGGQSYDIVVQIWDSIEEPESIYGNRMVDAAVFEKGGQIITVFDITKEADNATIISTFQVFE